VGNIPEKLVGVIKKIRQPIDKGLDKIVAWLGAMLKKIAGAITGENDKRTIQEKERDVKLAKSDAQAILNNTGAKPKDILASLPGIKTKYKLTTIALENLGNNEYDILVKINPVDKTEKKTVKGGVEIPPNLIVGIYIKFEGQIWKVRSIDLEYVIVSHATNVNDTKKFVVEKFVENFKNGQFPSPTDKEIKDLEAIDPNWKNKIIGNPQVTGTPGHAEQMNAIAEKYAKQTTVKFVYLDRQYRTITVMAGNKLTNQRRPDVVVEHMSGRLDVIEVRSKTDDPRDLTQRNLEVMQGLPKSMQGSVTVSNIPGVTYPGK
jgi:hypothetical protein